MVGVMFYILKIFVCTMLFLAGIVVCSAGIGNLDFVEIIGGFGLTALGFRLLEKAARK